MAAIDASFHWPLKAPAALTLVAVLAVFFCYPESGLEMLDHSMDGEGDTSGTSFRPDCGSEESDDGQVRGSTAYTSPELPPLPDRPEGSLRDPKPTMQGRVLLFLDARFLALIIDSSK
ncbi:hypothetical protein N7481_001621 [Penicillium waksmanii]|uniref:uncharacterized protein n=1 Tax=Penicillium waksmanii TaxID=69791 RepID=UPI0025494636|nr:uncharacterized protein N7481_001621 [Penicillium waksmanii]KAJ6001212.1 hypothetical protein N7481_001621 [Penicillium waksmanii]